MQLYCRNCLEPVSEKDTFCQKCGDSSLPPQTYAEMPPDDKKEIYKRAKANKACAIKMVFYFVICNVIIIAVLYKYDKFGLISAAFAEFYMLIMAGLYCGWENFIKRAAQAGQVPEEKGYTIGRNWCLSLGILFGFIYFILKVILY